MSEMKPQCNTSADCLRELARVMDQFGITSSVLAMVNSIYVKYTGVSTGGSVFMEIPSFHNPKDWQFAIAEVEGKPVFPYQEGLYCIQPSIKETFVPISYDQVNSVLRDASNWCISPEGLSWNPPKLATVMVELTVEDAKWAANYAVADDAERFTFDRIGLSCKAALEKLKS